MTNGSAHLVERFYYEVWNNADEIIARKILHPNVRFRGSLAVEADGIDGFIAYMRAVHAALGNYTCRIDHLVANKAQAATRMMFAGVHKGEFLGVPATGRQVSWAGSAFFKTDQRVIIDIWVLGDIDVLRQQLGQRHGHEFGMPGASDKSD